MTGKMTAGKVLSFSKEMKTQGSSEGADIQPLYSGKHQAQNTRAWGRPAGQAGGGTAEREPLLVPSMTHRLAERARQ